MAAPYTADIAKKYKDFLNDWDWQCHLTLTFRRPHHLHNAMKKARTFLNKIGRDNPTMKYTAAILGTKGTGRNHVHAIILCDQKRPITFQNISLFQLEQRWKQNGTIEMTTDKEWDNDTITGYLTKKKNLNLHNPDSYDLDFYRPQLLRQFRRTRT